MDWCVGLGVGFGAGIFGSDGNDGGGVGSGDCYGVRCSTAFTAGTPISVAGVAPNADAARRLDRRLLLSLPARPLYAAKGVR